MMRAIDQPLTVNSNLTLHYQPPAFTFDGKTLDKVNNVEK